MAVLELELAIGAAILELEEPAKLPEALATH